MFIQSYEKMREYLYNNTTIETLIQFEYSAFEEATVPICTFAFQNSYIDKKGKYIRLTDFRGGMEVQRKKTLEAISNRNCGFYYEQNVKKYAEIPGSPIAYWLSEKMYEAYKYTNLDSIAQPRHGLATSDNARFLRLWYEVNLDKTSTIDKCNYEKKWFPMNKGGSYRNGMEI